MQLSEIARKERILMTSLTYSDLKPSCIELQTTSDYLDILLNTLFEWLVWIWLTFICHENRINIVENATK